MAERLIVRNFGPIKDVDLDLQQTTIFIGEQASGKSTLAKLIGIFRDGNTINLTKEDLLFSFEKFSLGDFFKKNTLINYKSEKKDLIYENRSFQVLEHNYETDDFKELQEIFNTSEYRKSVKEGSNAEINATLMKIMNNSNDPNKIFQKIFNFTREKTNIHNLYIPAERTLIPMIAKSLFSIIDEGIGLPKTITGFGNLFESSRRNMKEVDIRFLNLKYKFVDKKDIIIDGKSKLELSDSSSGLQALIPMILVLSYNSNPITFLHFIIEEPELNLYPTTQYDLTKFIVEKCTNENHQLTITTHSPYLLSALNILLFAHQVGQIDEVAANKIIPKESWVNPQKFAAYFLEKGGMARPIFDKEAGMISENELDNVSLNLGDEFDKLMNIYQAVSA